MTRDLMLKILGTYVVNSQTSYAIFLHGERLRMNSGKMSWATRGHTKSALLASLKNDLYGSKTPSKEVDLILKELEEKVIVEFKELK